MAKYTSTKGVETLLGPPAKAIVALAIPTMVASSVHSIYNLADMFWVAGLGSNALAAVGFSFPFMMVGIAISRCFGTGGGSAVSRRIGAKDYDGASATASIVIQASLIVGLLVSLALVLFTPFLLNKMGAEGEVLRQAALYSRITYSSTIFIIFMQTAIAILRGEGAAKGAMKIMMLGSIFNIIADPILIYGLNMGVAGAALGTFLANLLIALVITWKMCLRKSSFVQIKLWGVKWRRNILWDIARVGVPSMAAMGGTMVMSFCVTIIAAYAGGPETVAIYIVGRRIINLATMPIYGFANAATAVCGAWYGANDHVNFRKAYLYAVYIALGVQLVLTSAIFVFALYIARAFTWGENNPELVLGLIVYLRIVPWMNPVASVGWVTAAMFQGVGKGFTAMIMNIMRTAVLTVLGICIFVFIFELGRLGLWWGFIFGAVIYLPFAVGFGRWYLQRNRNGFINNEYH